MTFEITKMTSTPATGFVSLIRPRSERTLDMSIRLTEEQQSRVNAIVTHLQNADHKCYSDQDVELGYPPPKVSLRSIWHWADAKEITTPFVATDQRTRPILVYFPDYISPQAVSRSASGVNELLEKVPLHVPPSDPRHSTVGILPKLQSFHPKRVGTLHCACWLETGHHGSGPAVSRQVCSGSRAHNATTRFVQSAGMAKDELSLLYAASHRSSWSRCVENFTLLRDFVPGARVLDSCPLDPWASFALISNLPSVRHVDQRDARTALSALYSFGSFGTMHLHFPSLKIKLRMREGTAVLFNSFFLPHETSMYDPEASRYAVDFFNHEEVLRWVDRKAIEPYVRE